MKTKRVWRYYCDFCKKSGCNKAAIIKHEKHCAMNPERKCRMCELIDNKQESMVTLFGILDSEGLEGLRDATDNCPVCIFATLRQANKFNGKEMPEYDFDFKKEADGVFAEMNQAQREKDEFYPYL